MIKLATKYLFVSLPAAALILGIFSAASYGQDTTMIMPVVAPDAGPSQWIIDLVGSAGMPGALVAVAWFLSKVVDQLRVGGIPVRIEVELDSKTRRLVREAAKIHGPDEDDSDEP